MSTIGRSLGATGSFQLELPDVGVLDFRAGEESVVFLGLYGEERVFPGHPLANSYGVVTKAFGVGAILARERGEAVYRFSAEEQTLEVAFELHRAADDNSGFMFLRLIPLHDDLLVVYENGLASLDPSHAVRWHVPTQMWGYSGLEVGPLTFEYFGVDGHHWVRRIDSGQEVLGRRPDPHLQLYVHGDPSRTVRWDERTGVASPGGSAEATRVGSVIELADGSVLAHYEHAGEPRFQVGPRIWALGDPDVRVRYRKLLLWECFSIASPTVGGFRVVVRTPSEIRRMLDDPTRDGLDRLADGWLRQVHRTWKQLRS